MNSIHSPKLKSYHKNLYIFPKNIVTKELIKILESQHEVRSKSYDYFGEHIKLVPTSEYFISYGFNEQWACKQKIIITKKQVDKFLTLYKAVDMTFLDYIELELTK